MDQPHSPRFSDQSSSADSGQDPGRHESQHQSRVEELLDQWEATYEAGEPIELETLCQQDLELIDEVRDRIKRLRAVDKHLQRRKEDRLLAEPVQITAVIDALEFVSAGGLGEVFVGEDSRLHRRVAVKFMHSKLCSDSEGRNRFALEAEVTGRLEHPGVVPLYGTGCTEDERLFYAMRYIDGETLDSAISRYFERLDDPDRPSEEAGELQVEFRRLLSHFVSVCKTIAYAHNRGIVHRDIKPANVMIGRFGETIVVDWGLAVPVTREEQFKSSGEKTLMPSSGSSTGSTSGRGAGTPAFMSPEQASELAPTPASDLYSLGATLFKIISGKPPVRSKALHQIRHDLIDGRLPVLDEIRDDIPKALQAITYKAMSRDAKDRYPTASELARDVERFLADEPISAARDSLGVRVARVARKHRAAAQAAVLGLASCVLIAGVSAMIFAGMANQSRRLQNRNLVTSSQLVSRSLGREIDRIWRVLQSVAENQQVRTYADAANRLEDAESNTAITVQSQADLQTFLEAQLGTEYSRLLDRLFVLSRHGTQLGRAPLPEEPQVGQNFAYRDYFTGLGYDLKPDDRMTRTLEPLTGTAVHEGRLHMSPAYLSTLAGEKQLKVTLTVPLLADDGETRIGVVGTSLDVGNMLVNLLGSSEVWLADFRDTRFDDELSYRGLILTHPEMGLQNELKDVPRLDVTVVESISERFAQMESIGESEDVMTLRDPVRDQQVRAAVQPIVIQGIADEPLYIGWAVIAAEGEH